VPSLSADRETGRSADLAWPTGVMLTPRLPDFLSLSFVFIDILGSFVHFRESRVEEAKVSGAALWSDFLSSRHLDIFTLPFIFINILALFPQFCKLPPTRHTPLHPPLPRKRESSLAPVGPRLRGGEEGSMGCEAGNDILAVLGIRQEDSW